MLPFGRTLAALTAAPSHVRCRLKMTAPHFAPKTTTWTAPLASSEEASRVDVLRVEGLTVQYGALVALRDVSWQVRPGEILGIIGPNGAGKSSCFAAVTNAVRRSGRVFLENADVSATKT